MTVDPLVPRAIDLPTTVPLDLPAGGPAREEALRALDDAKIFAAPGDPAAWPAWRAALHAWRDDAHRRHAYTDAAYRRPEAAWAARCRTVAQVWLWDELLFSFDEQRFTPERLLADAARFGGLDAVVLWHAYPVIGVDDRNQWDFYRDVPGIEALVTELQAAGLHVFVDYNPWDTGTRRARDDLTELAALVRDLGADGVFLDTLRKAEPELVARLEEARPGLVLEGESKLPVERIADHASSWAQFFADSPVPGVLRAHWFERRHMQHHVRRWHRDHTEELQSAWLNGVGVMVWEVVFGVWVGWSPRDASLLRRMVTIQRAAGDLLLDGEWTPLAPLHADAHAAGVFASAWTLGGVTLLTLVNRTDAERVGPVLGEGPVPGTGTVHRDGPDPTGGRLLDLTTGEDLGLDAVVTLPARGVGAVLHLAEGVAEPPWVGPLRDAARRGDLHVDPDHRFPHRLAHRLAPAAGPGTGRGGGPGAVPGAAPGAGQPEVPERATAVVVPAGDWVLTVRYRARETGMYQGAPYVDEWKPLPPRLHDPRTLQRHGTLAAPVVVAAREVTDGEFHAFLLATGYRPDVAHRFLAHWDGDRPAQGSEDAPVTHVDLADARAYCAWRGGRLPTEDEWQLAAGTGRLGRGTPAVWSWTESEHTDGRTRFVMLKGGSDHRAEGSDWYVEGGVQPPEVSVKLLLPGLGLARSATIGFRCAWDLAPASPDHEAAR